MAVLKLLGLWGLSTMNLITLQWNNKAILAAFVFKLEIHVIKYVLRHYSIQLSLTIT